MQIGLFKPDSEPMRALSWKQPYASLMLHGKIETRTWKTSYRGLVLICASQKQYVEHELFALAGEAGAQRIFNFINKNGIREPLGKAIAVGRLIDCRPMTLKDEGDCYVKYKKPWIVENKQGKHVTKRLWCHIYDDVKPIEQFDWKGSQGWGTVVKADIDRIKYSKI